MGIKNLSKFLKQKFPQILKEVHISEYTEKKVAVDISSYMYKYKKMLGEKWLDFFTRFILTFRKYNVHILIVFDSGSRIEKFQELKNREKERMNYAERTRILENDLENAKETGEISELLNDFQTKNKIDGKHIAENGKIVNFSVLTVESLLEKRRKQEDGLTREDFINAEKMILSLGIPVLRGEHEAEMFCCELALSGKVDAVLTEDTDCLAYGCPTVLYSYQTKENTCFQINFGELLNELGFTQEQFTDLCVMCGNDYNSNIPNIGVVKAYNLLKEHKNIENVEKQGICADILNYKRTRVLFQAKNDISVRIPYCDVPIREKVYDTLRDLSINVYPNEIERALYAQMGEVGEIEEMPFSPFKSFLKKITPI